VFFEEWEAIETEEEKAHRQIEEEYAKRRDAVKEKFGVEHTRQRLTDLPTTDDPKIEIRK